MTRRPGGAGVRASSQRPEGAAEHRDAAAGEDTAGEEEGGWRHPGGRREDERPLPGRLAAPGTGLDHSVIAFGEAAGQGRRGRSPTLSAAAKNVWEREYSKGGGSNYVNNNSSSG